MFPGNGHAVTIHSKGKKIAPVQPLSGVAGTDEKVKLLPQGCDLPENSLVVVLKGDNVELEARQLLTDPVPKVHKWFAGVEDGRPHAEGCGRLCRGQTGLRNRFFRIGKQLSRVLVNDPPGLCQGNAVVGPREQGKVQMLFQGVDLLDHRRG